MPSCSSQRGSSSGSTVDSLVTNGCAAMRRTRRLRSTPTSLPTDVSATLARVGRFLGVVTNLFDSERATFGTFNENRQMGELERFLTPLNALAFKLVVRREPGHESNAGD